MNCQNCNNTTKIIDVDNFFKSFYIFRKCEKCFLEYSFYDNKLYEIKIKVNEVYYSFRTESLWVTIQGINKFKLIPNNDNYAKYFYKYINNLIFE